MYKAEVKAITPDDAMRLLGENYAHNRNINNSYVSQLAMVMSEGRFDSENGQTIVIGSDGTLYDGQHRLTAQAIAGKTYRYVIVTVDNGGSKFKTIDIGRKRYTADFIFDPNSKGVAAIARIAACIEWGNTPLLSCLQGKITAKTLIDNGLMLDYYAQNSDEIQNAFKQAKKMKGKSLSGALTSYAIFYFAISRYCDSSRLGEFADELANLTTQNATVAQLKLSMAEKRGGRGNGSLKYTLGTLLCAYAHFIADDGSTTFNKQAQMLEKLDRAICAARKSAGIEAR